MKSRIYRMGELAGWMMAENIIGRDVWS